MLHAERLYELIGREQSLSDVDRVLRHYVQSLKPPVVGAVQVHCSDEAERECSEAFRRGFVRYLLPTFRFSSKSAFLTVNLGARYEWASIRVAEDHFAAAKGADEWKVMLVKINSHVAVDEADRGLRFGQLARFEDADSIFCGALHALTGGGGRDLPFLADLEQRFCSEGVDRLASLADPGRVRPEHASLFTAVASARLQARWAMMDIQDHEARSPTLWLVLASVTLNRAGHDTELPVGIYVADHRGEQPVEEYCGLGDRPDEYGLADTAPLRVTDPGWTTPRRARDHRSLVLERWRAMDPKARGLLVEPRVSEAIEAAREARSNPRLAKGALGALLPLLVELTPVPAAALLFGAGVVKIHHAARAHRLLREAGADEAARVILSDLESDLDRLPPERARHVIDLFLEHHGMGSEVGRH